MKTTKERGFTLIELLVVIVIIGILAGLLFPAITGALYKSSAQSMLVNGKQFVMAVISANIERDAAMNLPPVWPWMTGTQKGVAADGTKKECGPYASGDSNVYFADMIEFKFLDDLDYSIFAGEGVKSAGKDRKLFETPGYNAWNVVSGLDHTMSGDTPFMWTCNLTIAKTDLEAGSPTTEGTESPKVNWMVKLDKAKKPFGQKRVMLVTKGGSSAVIAGKFFFDSSIFMRGASFTGKTFEVLTAK
jgi:prepilin-type N-terminal cleavage/methylation domain-containing protein